ncbi:TPA: hypothetical protein ACGPW2_003356, partial [Escherichia coli]
MYNTGDCNNENYCCDVFVTCPGRNFVTLKITTESGLC